MAVQLCLYYKVMCSSYLKSPTLEERLHRVYWEDGSLDLVVGTGVVLIGVSWLYGQVALGSVVPALLIPVWIGLRKLVVDPRMGQVVFSEKRQERGRSGLRRMLAAGAASLGCAMVAIALIRGGGNGRALVEVMSPAIPALLIALAGLLSGLLFQMPRLMVYGCCAVVAGCLGIPTNSEPAVQILATGLIPLVAGGVLLGRFVWAYPKPEEVGHK